MSICANQIEHASEFSWSNAEWRRCKNHNAANRVLLAPEFLCEHAAVILCAVRLVYDQKIAIKSSAVHAAPVC
jgi:hypothetical protein